MTERERVTQHVWDRMVRAFARGAINEAQSLEAFYGSLEKMTDAQYDKVYDSDDVSAIS